MSETKRPEGPQAKPGRPSDNSSQSETIDKAAGGEAQRRSNKQSADQMQPQAQPAQREIDGREGPDPTRYGDWEKAGRCIDF